MSCVFCISSTACFSVSPKPTMRCIPTFPLFMTCTASSTPWRYLCHLCGPLAALPLSRSNIWGVAQSIAIPILSAPASLSFFISSLWKSVGVISAEIGIPTSWYIFLITSISASTALGFVIVATHTL